MQTLLSTAYLPPINYFQIIVNTDLIVVEQFETYPKQTYRNRCYIYGPNGKQLLSIPVTKPNGNHTQTKDIIIDNKSNWQQQHWRSITTAYNNTPYFEYFADALSIYFNEPFENLLTFNTALTNTLCKLIGIEKQIEFTTVFFKDNDAIKDYRNTIHPKEQQLFNTTRYFQSFEDKHSFIPNLSIIDLLFNIGPNTYGYLKEK